MSDTSARKTLSASCIERVCRVYCPHKKLPAKVTTSKWQIRDGQWTLWVIVDCPLLNAGLIDCDMSCGSQLDGLSENGQISLAHGFH
jgi:hypothetical protein